MPAETETILLLLLSRARTDISSAKTRRVEGRGRVDAVVVINDVIISYSVTSV